MSTVRLTLGGGEYEVIRDSDSAPVLASVDGTLSITTGYGTYGRYGGVEVANGFAAAVQEWADAYEVWVDDQEHGR